MSSPDAPLPLSPAAAARRPSYRTQMSTGSIRSEHRALVSTSSINLPASPGYQRHHHQHQHHHHLHRSRDGISRTTSLSSSAPSTSTVASVSPARRKLPKTPPLIHRNVAFHIHYTKAAKKSSLVHNNKSATASLRIHSEFRGPRKAHKTKTESGN